MNPPDDIQTALPLTESTFFIMLSLSYEPKHGYAIMKEVRALSENRVILSTGTLYGVLKRLLEQGWIERLDCEEAGFDDAEDNSRVRKAYSLSKMGGEILNAEIARLRKLVSAISMQSEGKRT